MVDAKWGDGSADTKFTVTAAGTIPAKTHTYGTVGSKTISVTVTDSAGHVSNTATYHVNVSAPPTVTLSGTVFYDPNKNGTKDSGDAGLGGWEVYDDVNNNNKLDSGDIFTFTNATGGYTFSMPGVGTAVLRQIIPTNWTQTGPASSKPITVALNSIASKTGLNFGDTTTIKYLSTVATTSGIVAWWTFDTAS